MSKAIPFPSPVSTAPDFRFYTADELEQLPPSEWLVEDICFADSQVLLWGASGKGKSFVAVDLALSVCTGLDWHGHKVKKGPVFYIVGEGGPGLRDRVKAWRLTHGIVGPIDAFFTMTAPQLTDPKHLTALVAAMQKTCGTPVLIVLDTLARTFVGKEENSAKDMGEWVQAAAHLQRQLKATVLTVHHTGKDEKSERGSVALRGALDTSISVTKSKNTISVSSAKQRDTENFEKITLTLKTVDLPDARFSAVVVDGPDGGVENVGLGPQQRRLLKGLARCGAGPTALAVWREEVEKDGQGAVPPKTFENWMKPLMEDDYVVRPPGKRGHYQLTAIGKAANATQPPMAAAA